MANRYSGSVICNIPLSYKCQKCGADAFATIPLKKDYSFSYCMFNGSLASQREEAIYHANIQLKNTVAEVYSKSPLDYKGTIYGQCRSCGHQELWQTSLKKDTVKNYFGTIFGYLFAAVAILVPILLRLPILALLMPFIILIFVFSYDNIEKRIKEKYPSQKAKNKQTEISQTPSRNQPSFILTREEMLDKIKINPGDNK